VISFPDAVRRGFQQYATFSGRANRPEYWWWVLFVWLVDVVASILDGIVGTGIGSSGYYGVFGLVVGLALLVPNIAVSIRRLHDTNKSGWMFLLFLIPCAGIIIWIIFMVQEGTPGDNNYGPPSTA